MTETTTKPKRAGRELDDTRSLVAQASRTAHHNTTARREEGKAMRSAVPRESHSQYAPSSERPDPIALLQSQDKIRIESLLPIRYGRMATSPFSFYRGSAIVMAHDLAGTPSTGWLAQACGDAHLENFGAFGTGTGSLVFDVNDFDETYPAPWEWDLKRLAASAVLATATSVPSLPSNGRQPRRPPPATEPPFSALLISEFWLAGRPSSTPQSCWRVVGTRPARSTRSPLPALRSTNLGAFPKLTTLVDGQRVLKEKPPLVVRITDQAELATVRQAFGAYLETLPPDMRLLLGRFSLVDFARKVVGVGSVGMPAYVGLYMSADDDPLFLQLKMATESVLAQFVAIDKPLAGEGERVVVGQRLMQAAGDPMLGWTTDGAERPFYVRQLRDMKYSFDVASMKPAQVTDYVDVCAKVLARAHSRTGDPALIAGYLGNSNKRTAFDRAITDFAVAYADQTKLDHAALVQAISDGRVEAHSGI